MPDYKAKRERRPTSLPNVYKVKGRMLCFSLMDDTETMPCRLKSVKVFMNHLRAYLYPCFFKGGRLFADVLRNSRSSGGSRIKTHTLRGDTPLDLQST